MAEVRWIKLAVGLPDNKKIKQIRRLPSGDTIALMWIFLMCLAGETNENGLVYFTPEIPFTDEMLAQEFDMDLGTVRMALNTFKKFGMIDIVEDFIFLNAWEKWQAVDKLSEIREQNRLRKQKQRERQKLLPDVSRDCHVTVTQCHATDKEEEKEREEENIYSSAAQKKTTRFIPPSVEEVSQYCKERGNNVSAERFVDYYTANGWKVGINPMKDWKAAVRTWERNEKTTTLQKDNELAGIFE